MTRRPHSHRVRDAAALAVEMVFAANGWATEPIWQDYGEDLLVQPVNGDAVEPFRIWVQVKGVMPNSTTDPWRVSRDHVRRWIRSRDYVVFVVWEIGQASGKYCLPRHQVHDSELLDGDAKSVALKPDAAFDVDAVRTLYAVARLDHAAQMILMQQVHASWHPFEPPKIDTQTRGKNTVVAILEAISWLGVLRQDGGSWTWLPDFRETYARAATHVGKQKPEKLAEVDLPPDRAALVIAMMSWVEKTWNVTAPVELAHKAAVLLLMLQENGAIPTLDGGRAEGA